MVQAGSAALYRDKAFVSQYVARQGTLADTRFYERQAVLKLLPDVAGKTVLDAGCGPGLYTEWLQQQGAIVTAIDESPRMVAHVREKLPQVALHQADLEHPSPFLTDGTFDLVLCAMVLLHVRDWEPVLHEFYRVLTPGGVLVVSTIHPFADLEPLSDYFAIEEIEEEWSDYGIWMPSYRRPLGLMVQSFTAAGFVVQQLVEPQANSPDPFVRYQPWVVCFRLQKP